MAAHILFNCRFSTRIWNAVRCWLDVPELDIAAWAGVPSLKEWWARMVLGRGHRRKAVSSLLMLVSWDWELWKERNARVFQKKFTMPTVVVECIKVELKNWLVAGAKYLGSLMT